MEVWTALAVVAATVLVYKILNVLWIGVWEPLRFRRVMKRQGVKGPPFRFLIGNTIDIGKFGESFPDALPLGKYTDFAPTIMPQYALYCPKYGKNFVYQYATATRFVVRDPEIAKEIFVENHKFLKRSSLEDLIVMQLLGKGLSSQFGERWSSMRQTLNPFFHQEGLKGMTDAMVEATTAGIQKWEKMVTEGGGSAEIDVEPDVHKISERIISLTAFGGDYDKGEQIYKLQRQIGIQIAKSLLNPLAWLMPNYRLIPTKANKSMVKCQGKVDALIHELMDGRRNAVFTGETSSYGEDLLGRMLTAATDGWDMKAPEFNMAAVFNNCKLFYFAAEDNVASTIAFSMLMLANHPEWQDRARQEVLEVLGDGEKFNPAALTQLKVLGMILNETLRLFSSIPILTRETTKDLQLKELFIPKGMIVEVAIVAIHQDKEYWGDDVTDFNPERFSNGVSGACSHPHAFMPFGLGPKYCIGNNFALMEAKIVLSKVLRKFQLAVSPNYKHHPTFKMVQKPKFGMPLILKPL